MNDIITTCQEFLASFFSNLLPFTVFLWMQSVQRKEVNSRTIKSSLNGFTKRWACDWQNISPSQLLLHQIFWGCRKLHTFAVSMLW